jgi:uncharacterized protein GlcG (DUF336 family)
MKTSKCRQISVGAFFLLMASGVASAQNSAPTAPSAPVARPPAPPAARGPALDLSLEAAQVAIETCKARDQKAAVSVVDSAGVLRVLLATDGASPRGVTSSTSKAVTALTFKAATSQLAERLKTDPEFAEKIAANPAFNARAGGIPLVVEGEYIGAIGVGGARGSEVDEACGLAGLQKIQARLR